ncbi:MAG: ABC transporter permease, partial [Cyanobacteria bacterium J06631_6]
MLKAYLRRTPIAWLQLSHQKVRLLVAILGVAFSIILIFTQLGLRAMLFDGVTLLPENLNGDLYLISTYADNIRDSDFPSIYLYQADAVAGVADVRPLYMDFGRWVDPKLLNSDQGEKANIKSSSMQVIAFNPNKPVLQIPEVNRQRNLLSVPGGILYDRLSKSAAGDIPQLFAEQGKVSSILNNRRVTVMGLFDLGSTFYYDGVAIMSDWNYGQIRGIEKLKEVSLGIVSLEPGTDLEAVRKRMRQSLSQDLKVLTKAELAQAEKDEVATWSEGKVLNFGAAIGFVVGIIIVYQVIYTDVSEHLPEYATLKA